MDPGVSSPSGVSSPFRPQEKIGPVHIQLNQSTLDQSPQSAKKAPDFLPVVQVQPTAINGVPTEANYKAVMDTGATTTLFLKSKVPEGCTLIPIKPIQATTAAGTFVMRYRVVLTNVKFPEFSTSLKIQFMQALVFDSDCVYDMIVGRD